jgi:hypothetical protein
MNKNTIKELSDYSLHKIIEFSEFYRNEDISNSSFSNWNARDVIGHINSWINYSEEKLESIRNKRSFDEASHIDIEKFNETNYTRNKNFTLETVITETRNLFDKYAKILNSFNEDELKSKKFPTGFSFELWKYMAMDVFIHPVIHILYHYIKRKDYKEFIDEIKKTKNNFMDYSDNDINVYYIGDLFETKEEKNKRFIELKEYIQKDENKTIDEIIVLNLKK